VLVNISFRYSAFSERQILEQHRACQIIVRLPPLGFSRSAAGGLAARWMSSFEKRLVTFGNDCGIHSPLIRSTLIVSWRPGHKHE